MVTDNKQGITKDSIHYEKEDAVEFISKNLSKVIKNRDVQFACIGTDRSTGDAFAPIIGTMLESLGYDVVGTLKNPFHADNIHEKIKLLSKDKVIIAVDACLGDINKIGNINIGYGAITPGAGVGKVLPKVGDLFITGTVNVGGYMEYLVLQNTRLGVVWEMAEKTVNAIRNAFSLEIVEDKDETVNSNLLREVFKIA